MKPSSHLLLAWASLAVALCCTSACAQDISVGPDIAARNDARKIAIKFRERGYTITPLSQPAILGKATLYEFTAEKATDCVIMVGVDAGMAVNVIVKDEVGNIVAQDNREMARACVSFTASYSGTYSLYVLPERRANAAGTFSVLLGARTNQAITR